MSAQLKTNKGLRMSSEFKQDEGQYLYQRRSSSVSNSKKPINVNPGMLFNDPDSNRSKDEETYFNLAKVPKNGVSKRDKSANGKPHKYVSLNYDHDILHIKFKAFL